MNQQTMEQMLEKEMEEEIKGIPKHSLKKVRTCVPQEQ